MAQVAYGTIAITDTTDIERIYIEYIKTSSGTSEPSSSDVNWSENAPTWENGKYIWSRTVTKYYGVASLVYGDPVCITGTGSVGAAPAWDTVTKSDVGLGNVENTALSTWVGSANVTTVGTISSGTWSGSTVAVNKGGTGATTFTSGEALIGNGTNAIQTRAITNVTSGAVAASTNLVTANSLVAHVANKIAAMSDAYVTLATAQTLTAAATKTYLGLQTYGSNGIAFGTTSGSSVTSKAIVKYDSSLDAIVFLFN